jgi:superfamily II DNA helicase RecQ
METVKVRKTSTEFIFGVESHWSVLICFEEERSVKTDSIMGAPSEKIFFPAETELNKDETFILESLKKWRHGQSIKTSLPGYMICNNAELVTISKVKPKNIEELGKIKGFSSKKLLKYGDDVLALLNSV